MSTDNNVFEINQLDKELEALETSVSVLHTINNKTPDRVRRDRKLDYFDSYSKQFDAEMADRVWDRGWHDCLYGNGYDLGLSCKTYEAGFGEAYAYMEMMGAQQDRLEDA